MAKAARRAAPGTGAPPDPDDETGARAGEDTARAALDEHSGPDDDTGDPREEGSIVARAHEGDAPNAGRPDRDKPDNPKFIEDPREAIAANYSKRSKGEEADEEDGDDEEEIELNGADDAEDEATIVRTARSRGRDPDEARPGPAESGARRIELADDDVVIVKVDGRDVEMPWKDIRGRAQKDVAADTRFEQATRLLSEVRDLARTRSTRESNDDAGNQGDRDTQLGDAARTDPGRKTIDRARLREIADKIQSGSAEDGADALANLIDDALTGGSNLSEEQIVARVRDQMVRDNDVDRAVSRFTTDYGDTFSPTGEFAELGSAVFKGVSAEMLRDMEAIGVPSDYLDQIASDPAEIFKAHEDYRTGKEFAGAGWRSKMRNYESLLSASADTIAAKYGIEKRTQRREDFVEEGDHRPARNGTRKELGSPQPTRFTISERRQIEKRELPMQPRPASVRSDQRESGQPPRYSPGTNSSAVARMRQDRQQSTV